MCALCSSKSYGFTLPGIWCHSCGVPFAGFESAMPSVQSFILSSGLSILFSTGTLDLVQTSIPGAEAFIGNSDRKFWCPFYAGAGMESTMI